MGSENFIGSPGGSQRVPLVVWQENLRLLQALAENFYYLDEMRYLSQMQALAANAEARIQKLKRDNPAAP